MYIVMVIWFVICHQPHHTWINPQLLDTFLFIPHLREPGEICTYTPSSTKTPHGRRWAGPTRHESHRIQKTLDIQANTYLEKVSGGFSV